MNKDYKNLQYQFHKLKAGESVLTAYQDLAEIPIFHEEKGLPQGISNEFVMRYIILMYANGSPAIEKFHHIGKRKTWVMKELGVEADNGNKFPPLYDDLLLNKNALVLQKKAAFLTLQKPSDWQIWMNASEQLYYLLSTPTPNDDKAATERVKLVNELNAQINKHREAILEHETSVLVESALTTFMAVTTLGLRPEERVMFNIKAVPPHKAKANVIYPEVGN